MQNGICCDRKGLFSKRSYGGFWLAIQPRDTFSHNGLENEMPQGEQIMRDIGVAERRKGSMIWGRGVSWMARAVCASFPLCGGTTWFGGYGFAVVWTMVM